MKRRLLLLAAAILVCLPAWGRGRLQGWCQDGNLSAYISPSSTASAAVKKVQQSYPSCTVTVYAAGTTTISTIYSDMAGTAKANPFTAASSGQWFFYADDGNYDVKFSGGGISSPFTIGDMSSGGAPTSVDCSKFSGASMSARVNACLLSLSPGGIGDAGLLSGAQSWTTDMFAGVTNPVTLRLGDNPPSTPITVSSGVTQNIPSNVSVIGNGMGRTVIKVANGSAANTKVFQNSDTVNGNTNIQLRDFTIDGNKANQTLYPQGGIIFSKVTSSIISHIEVKGTAGGPGFGVSGVEWTTNPNTSNTDNLIEFCSLHDNGTDGTNKADGLAIGGVRIRIIGNSLRNNQDTGIGFQGNSTSDVVISANDIESNVLTGIAMGSNGTTQGDNVRVIITGNNIRANGDNVFLQRANNVMVTGNLIASSSGSGNTDGMTVISVQGLTVTGNRILSNQANGILVNDTAAADLTNDAIISGNSIFGNNQSGIRLTVTNAGAKIKDFVIANNTVAANSQNPVNTVDGILVTPLASTDIVSLVISGNTLSDNQGVATQRYGLAFGTAPSKVSVVGNTAFGNATGSFSAIPADARAASNFDSSATSTGDLVTVGDGTSMALSSTRFIDVWGRDAAGNYRKLRIQNDGTNFWFGNSTSANGFNYNGDTGAVAVVSALNKNVTLNAGTGGIDLAVGAAPIVAAGHVGLGGTTQATIGANGAASALTANPVGYLLVNIGGASRIIPFYNP